MFCSLIPPQELHTIFIEMVFQKKIFCAVVSFGPLLARSFQRRNRDQDYREQAGRGALPHLDIYLQENDTES